LIYYVFLRIKQWWIFADLNAKSKPRNVILISGVMNLGCPSATIWVGLLTFFWPPNALQYGCLAVQ
jgi:dolichyl-phosphate-mannose--protein O-mannosyl transferase